MTFTFEELMSLKKEKDKKLITKEVLKTFHEINEALGPLRKFKKDFIETLKDLEKKQ